MGMRKGAYPDNWRDTSLRIREQAGYVCEHCGRKQGDVTASGGPVVMTVHHIGVPGTPGSPYHTLGDPQDKRDCRDENLICLCQRCHLGADLEIRKLGARYMEGERYRAHAMEASWRIDRVRAKEADEEVMGAGGVLDAGAVRDAGAAATDRGADDGG
jgi:hypothetical protein